MHRSQAYVIRSKNAGPFWLTFDIFCQDAETFRTLCADPHLTGQAIAAMMHSDPEQVRIFQMAPLNVIKISLPRPVVQGSVADRDMHGAQWGYVLAEELARAGV
ncbi:TPA: DUF4387 domain-containing protein [Pseudomonas aeruginosa]|uniref:DUF4387 domain-containing protein n=1 Tax=Pseudomonas aeruginosa TaxID=287 RepID=UPI0005B8C9DF|nr:DUF4387 domain-containing protein [Pseudomonas aeruginosa]ELM7155054.1 DUF4387 domain-containing protein [Pseudomonas aeruginosa]MBI7363590.1 DUF4387 domain-containing protein [Pseudomonas aeruginosa]NPS70552.1 DUF4387 domain-containing protein [Pseudomonas aeruginosa]PQM13710.1 DUF4387 domain-containing protein [Pseudomonas aeruginosa]TEE59213.1 DUF4387 domain-containing protein [Pseudomonas aeruginosa]